MVEKSFWLRIIFFLCLFFGAPAGVTPAAAGERHPFTVADLLAMERIGDPQVSPDGGRVAYTVARADPAANRLRSAVYITDLHRPVSVFLPPDKSDEDTNPRWSPDGKILYFLSARSGARQIWQVSPATRKPRQVTSLPLDVRAFEVSPDGSFFILAMAVIPGRTGGEESKASPAKKGTPATGSGMIFDRMPVRFWDTWSDGKRNHLFYYPLPGGPAQDLMAAMDADCPSPAGGGSEEFSLSPDGRSLVFTAKDEGRSEAWSTNSDLFMASLPPSPPEVPPAPPVRITANPAADTQPRFSPDGGRLAYLAMNRPGHEADRYRIIIRDLASGRERTLDLRADDTAGGDRSPDSLAWSPDGKTIYCTADHQGRHALFAVDTETGKSRLIVGAGNVVNPRPLRGGNVLYSWNSLVRPTELHLLDGARGESRRLTDLNDPRLKKIAFGETGEFSFPGAHGDTVRGRIVYPAGFDPVRKYPAVFIIHGGPQTSNIDEFHYRWNPQIYAGAGYAAVLIDFHGSTGYGQAFSDAIRDDWGGAPCEDIRKGVAAALTAFPFLDERRLAALGPSYGGYMINWIGGHTDRFRCLVSHAGILDLRPARYEIDTLWFPEWEFRDPELHNPSAHLDNWRTPVLITAGCRDYRVSYTQSLALFNALQRRGVPSRLLLFPGEGHWILAPQNSRQWHETVLAWLHRWLDGPGDRQGVREGCGRRP